MKTKKCDIGFKFLEKGDYLETHRSMITHVPLDEKHHLNFEAISFIRMLYLGAFVDV